MSPTPVTSSELRRQLATYQPLFGVRVVTPRLTLQLPTDIDLVQLLRVIDEGIHDPDFMPFLRGWTDTPSPQRDRDSLAHWWSLRSSWTPTQWNWSGAVYVNDEPIGVQNLMATDFATTRTVKSGSWIGRQYQGQGIGKEMRAAILHLAFEGLGAQRALSGFIEGNTASQRVSQAMGYEPVSTAPIEVRGVERQKNQVALDRGEWLKRRRGDIEIHGLGEALDQFGVS